MTVQLTSRTLCVLLAMAIFLGPARPAAAAQDPSSLRFLSGRSATVPLQVWEGLTFLQVRVNGAEPAWFVFDTGATINVIDPEFAQSLKLDLSDRRKDQATGREIVRAHGLTLAMGGLELSGQAASVMSLGDLGLFIGRPIAGVFGYELLSRAVVEIDYARQTLTVRAPEGFAYAGPGKTLPLEIVGKWPVAAVRLEQEGREAVENRLILDSGSLMPLSLMTGGLAANTVSVAAAAGITGVGAGDMRMGRITALVLGPWRILDPYAAFPPEEAKEDPDYLAKAVASTGIGLVGAPVLSRFKLVFEYAAKALVMEPGPAAGAPFEFDKSGLLLMCGSPRFEAFRILAVIKDSPAAEAGLKSGDVIVSVDGHSAAGLSLPQVREMFRKAGIRYELGVSRGDKTLGVSIVTRRLI